MLVKLYDRFTHEWSCKQILKYDTSSRKNQSLNSKKLSPPVRAMIALLYVLETTLIKKKKQVLNEQQQRYLWYSQNYQLYFYVTQTLRLVYT